MYCSRLMLGALDRDVVHVQAQRSLRDRGSIGRVILLAFDERLHIDWRDQPYVVAMTLREPAPEVAGGTGFHRHNAWRLLTQKLLQSSPRQVPVE